MFLHCQSRGSQLHVMCLRHCLIGLSSASGAHPCHLLLLICSHEWLLGIAVAVLFQKALQPSVCAVVRVLLYIIMRTSVSQVLYYLNARLSVHHAKCLAIFLSAYDRCILHDVHLPVLSSVS